MRPVESCSQPCSFWLGPWHQSTRSSAVGVKSSELAPLIGGPRPRLKTSPPSPLGIPLPRPRGRFVAQSASLYVPGLSRPILHDVNFVLEPGEALGIVGPSGAGKSTLARLIVGIQAPS